MNLPCLDNCDSSSELLSSRFLFAPCSDRDPASILLFIVAEAEEGRPHECDLYEYMMREVQRYTHTYSEFKK